MDKEIMLLARILDRQDFPEDLEGRTKRIAKAQQMISSGLSGLNGPIYQSCLIPAITDGQQPGPAGSNVEVDQGDAATIHIKLYNSVYYLYRPG